MAFASLQVKLQGQGFDLFQDAVTALGSESQAKRALTRAINHTGGKAFTATKRAGAKQVGLTQKKLVGLGGIDKRKANFSSLSYQIRSRGQTLSLKHFKARQFSFGVKAKPWGRTQKFHGTFINVGTFRSGIPFDDGHVYQRTTSKSFPVRRLYGPAIPTEIVKGESKAAFEDKARGLNDRLAHEVGRLTKGAVT